MLVEVLEARDVITLIHEVNGSETYVVNSMKQGAGELQLFVSVFEFLTVQLDVVWSMPFLFCGWNLHI